MHTEDSRRDHLVQAEMEIPLRSPAELLIKWEIKENMEKQACDHQRPDTEEVENLSLKYTVKNTV